MREDITKHTLNLFRGDYARLQELYPEVGGAAIVIRNLVRQHIERVEETLNEETDLAKV